MEQSRSLHPTLAPPNLQDLAMVVPYLKRGDKARVHGFRVFKVWFLGAWVEAPRPQTQSPKP